MSETDYDYLARVIDEELERGQGFSARLRAGEEASWICVDGAYLLTERVRDGHAQWMSGDCGSNHPNTEIEALLRAFALDRLGS